MPVTKQMGALTLLLSRNAAWMKIARRFNGGTASENEPVPAGDD
jgi:hypothetical protein